MLLADHLSLPDDATSEEISEWHSEATREDPDTMQVKIAFRGEWHRIMEDDASPYTRCGKPLTGAYSTRDNTYRGPLCTGGCFSAFELAHAALLRDQDKERELAQQREQDARDEEESQRRRDAFDFETGRYKKRDRDE